MNIDTRVRTAAKAAARVRHYFQNCSDMYAGERSVYGRRPWPRRDEGRPLLDRQVRLAQFLEERIEATLPHAVRASTAASYADQLRRHVVPVSGNGSSAS